MEELDAKITSLTEEIADKQRESEVSGMGVRLLDHLNTEQVYYYKQIWLNEDEDARLARLQSLRIDEVPVADLVENSIVDIQGEYIVMPINTGRDYEKSRFVGYEISDDGTVTATKREIDPPKPVVTTVTLPTPGVLAETQLSSCSACEKIDESRFWRWEESPCGCEAPEIAPITSGSRSGPIDLSDGGLPNGVVNILNPPALPNPTGLSGVAGAFSQQGLFGDMTSMATLGSLLESVEAGTMTADEAKAKAAQSSTGGARAASAPPNPNGFQKAIKFAQGLFEDGTIDAEEFADIKRRVTNTFFPDAMGKPKGSVRSLAWDHVDYDTVMSRVEELAANPDLFQQGDAPFCVEVTFWHLIFKMAKAMPFLGIRPVEIAKDLLIEGEAKIGDLEITPDADLRAANFKEISKTLADAQAGKATPNPQLTMAEWMLCSSIVDGTNVLLDFEGDPLDDAIILGNGLSFATGMDDLASWFEDIGLFTVTHTEFDSDLAVPSSDRAYKLPDRTELLSPRKCRVFAIGSKSDPVDTTSTAGHAFVLTKAVSNPATSEFEFDCWTYAQNLPLTLRVGEMDTVMRWPHYVSSIIEIETT